MKSFGVNQNWWVSYMDGADKSGKIWSLHVRGYNIQQGLTEVQRILYKDDLIISIQIR